MAETLRENLYIPKVGGEIEAFFYVRGTADILRDIESKMTSLRLSRRDGKISDEKYNELSYKVHQLQKAIVVDGYQLSERIFQWRINFRLSGPDARYKDAVCTLSSDDVHKLIECLESSSAKILALKKQAFAGKYTKSEKINTYSSLSIEVVAENGKIWLNFCVSSHKQKFTRKLDINDVEIAITKLKNAVQRGQQMAQTLERLSP